MNQRSLSSRKLLLIVPLLACSNATVHAAPPAADTVVTDARIYTADRARRDVEALAIRDGRILYAGDSAGAAAFAGPATRWIRYQGRRIIPGLIDAHVHPPGVVAVDVCDLRMQRQTLAQIRDFARQCLAKYKPAPGEWLTIENWNSDAGNEPDRRYPNSRTALDAASTTPPIQLSNANGHASAFNSAALALARARDGRRVGLSRRSLHREFASIRQWVGVDLAGEPDGIVMEDARDLLDAPESLMVDAAALMHAPQRMVQVFNQSGITAIQDASAYPELLGLYETLEKGGDLTLRVNLALYLNPKKYAAAGGAVDFDRMAARARAARERFAGSALVKADAVKVFVDGAVEGDPMAKPPTLPEAAWLRPYLQPIFGFDRAGALTVTGYVDTDSQDCRAVRGAGAL